MFDNLVEKEEEKESPEKAKIMSPINSFEGKSHLVMNNEDRSKDLLARFSEGSESLQKAGKLFEEKISKLRNRGEKRGKRYSIIGISLSLLIFLIVIFVGYKILSQVDLITREVDEQDENSLLTDYIDPDNHCEGSACCLASLEKIRKNDYMEISSQEDCPFGFEKKDLNCENSLLWCQIVEVVMTEIFNEIENVEENMTTTTATEGMSLEPLIKEDLISDPLADSDSDGLTNEDELMYGTDINNPDSDGDGFLDGAEVESGYNPMGEGYL